jgi:hypothetical protein
MTTVSLNFPKHTRRSCTFDAASGVSVKLRTTIVHVRVGGASLAIEDEKLLRKRVAENALVR